MSHRHLSRLVRSVLAVALLALAGCSSKNDPVSPAPSVQVSVDSLAFGGVAVNATHDLTVTVTNPGSTVQHLDAAVASVGFSIVSGGGVTHLAGGASHPITVRFAPTAGGHQTGSLAIGNGLPTVKLVGDGTTVSFRVDALPTLTQRCVGCHANFGGGAASLVGVRSNGYGTALLIKPYEPANSVLYAKIANLHTYGNAMPPGSLGVPAPEQTKWSTWILEGAHDN